MTLSKHTLSTLHSPDASLVLYKRTAQQLCAKTRLVHLNLHTGHAGQQQQCVSSKEAAIVFKLGLMQTQSC
jgi:hypothetical protein